MIRIAKNMLLAGLAMTASAATVSAQGLILPTGGAMHSGMAFITKNLNVVSVIYAAMLLLKNMMSLQ